MREGLVAVLYLLNRFAHAVIRIALVSLIAEELVCCRVHSMANEPYLVVLGIAQDGGYPQIGCQRDCCQPAWKEFANRRFTSCLALVDPVSEERWLFDCTPDFRDQMHLLETIAGRASGRPLDGILLTHAHIGHYSGLIHLGREVLGAQAVPLYCMPRMQYFIETNGPWSQLVKLGQVDIQRLAAAESTQLNGRVSVTPFLVPHRDEFSETVGFQIDACGKRAVFLPDIDKWERWQVPVESLIRSCDIAFLDGTFYGPDELPGRDMAEIPHPFVMESLQRFGQLPAVERAKIHFIHFNHSNPLNRNDSEAGHAVLQQGLRVAEQGNVWHFK